MFKFWLEGLILLETFDRNDGKKVFLGHYIGLQTYFAYRGLTPSVNIIVTVRGMIIFYSWNKSGYVDKAQTVLLLLCELSSALGAEMEVGLDIFSCCLHHFVVNRQRAAF